MKKIFFFIFFLITSSCYVKFPDIKNNNTNYTNNSYITNQKEFKRIISGNKSNIKKYETKLIDNEENFIELLNMHDSNYINKLYIPKVDFNLKNVIAIFLGDRPSSGYFVEIEKIIEEKDQVKVYIKEIKPQRGDKIKLEITQPFIIIEIEKLNKEISFINKNIPISDEIELSYNILDIGKDSLVKEYLTILVKNEKDFFNLYSKFLPIEKNNNGSLNIDFEKYMIAGIFLGKKDNNFSSIKIDKVIKTNSQIIIKASEIFVINTPLEEKEFYPYILLQIEKSNLPVNFEINVIF